MILLQNTALELNSTSLVWKTMTLICELAFTTYSFIINTSKPNIVPYFSIIIFPYNEKTMFSFKPCLAYKSTQWKLSGSRWHRGHRGGLAGTSQPCSTRLCYFLDKHPVATHQAGSFWKATGCLIWANILLLFFFLPESCWKIGFMILL